MTKPVVYIHLSGLISMMIQPLTTDLSTLSGFSFLASLFSPDDFMHLCLPIILYADAVLNMLSSFLPDAGNETEGEKTGSENDTENSTEPVVSLPPNLETVTVTDSEDVALKPQTSSDQDGPGPAPTDIPTEAPAATTSNSPQPYVAFHC